LRPPTTTHWFGAAVKRCQAADEKFSRVTIHELRHTAASLTIASGANVKTVQSQLGHKTATMTLDLYGHLFPDDLDGVADKMDDLVQDVPKKEAGQGENIP
jgi:integrase